MSTIYLIRHGQASFDSDNYDRLSDIGIKQAEILGRDFDSRLPPADAVFCGTMLRHQQTLQYFMNQQGQQDKTEVSLPSWNEFDHQQILAAYNPSFTTPQGVKQYVVGQPNPEQAFIVLFRAAFQRWISGEHDNYSETWAEFRLRVESGLHDVVEAIERDKLKSAFVFTSGGPISAVLMKMTGLPQDNVMGVNQSLVNCGVTKLIVSKGKLYLSSLNEHSVFDSAVNRHLITYK